MADMNIRGIEDGLLRVVKQAAIERSFTLREYVQEVLAREVGYDAGRVKGGDQKASSRKQTGSGESKVKGDGTTGEGIRGKGVGVREDTGVIRQGEQTAICRRCDAVLERDKRKPKYWYCFRCKRQLGEEDVKHGSR
jgi:hypothetical protein